MPPKEKSAVKKTAEKKAKDTAAKTPDQRQRIENDKDKQKIKELQDQLKKLQQEMKLLRKEVDIKDLKDYFQKADIEVSNYLNGLYEDQLAEAKRKQDVDVSKSTKDLQTRLEVSEKRLEEEKQKHEAAIQVKDAEIQYLKTEVQTGKAAINENKRNSPESDASIVKKLTEENRDLDEKLKEANRKLEEQRGIEKELSLTKEKYETPKTEKEKNSTETNKELQKQEDVTKQLTDKYKDLQKENEEHRTKIEQLEQTIQKMKQQHQKQEDETNREHRTKIEKLEETIQEMKQQHEKQKDETNSKSKGTDNDLQRKNEENKKLKEELQKVLEDKEELQRLNKEMDRRQKESENKSKGTDNDLQRKDEEIKKLKEELQKVLEDKEEELKRLNNEMDRRQKESEKQKKELLENRKSGKTSGLNESKELADAREEISELKNRLSKVVGAKVMDDNPNITDLSDENRPTKLAEQYSELYDNQWTDAFEEAENSNAGEQKTVRELYDLLVKMYTFCQDQAAKHATSIQNAVLALSGSDNKETIDKLGVTKVRLLKELRKSIAPHLVDQVFQLFIKEKKFNGKPKMEIFARECCKLCWLMASQDPPVVLDTTEAKGAFDGDRFRAYTKTGKTIDYVVWPALLLHKGGPLLGKGVAQGK